MFIFERIQSLSDRFCFLAFVLKSAVEGIDAKPIVATKRGKWWNMHKLSYPVTSIFVRLSSNAPSDTTPSLLRLRDVSADPVVAPHRRGATPAALNVARWDRRGFKESTAKAKQQTSWLKRRGSGWVYNEMATHGILSLIQACSAIFSRRNLMTLFPTTV